MYHHQSVGGTYIQNNQDYPKKRYRNLIPVSILYHRSSKYLYGVHRVGAFMEKQAL